MPKNPIAIAVIVPTYNRAELLKATLVAILQQAYHATEILVVDDGSTDDAQAVLAEFGETVKSVRIANSGPTIARKTGVEMTISPWLAFCDSDDTWLPNQLARRVA